MPSLRVALCQLDLVVGDLTGNVDAMLGALARAEAAGCGLAVFPELSVPGYPPEDLLLKPGFVADNQKALMRFAAATGTCVAVAGFVDDPGGPGDVPPGSAASHRARVQVSPQARWRNAAAVCAGGGVVGVEHKRLLPNYAVFDEQRYFAPGAGPHRSYDLGGVRMGVSICEDAWSPDGPLAEQGRHAEVLVNLSASPFHSGRPAQRQAVLEARAAGTGRPVVYVNLVGGQDELVFDGGSMVVGPGGLLARAAQFAEEVMVVDIEVDDQPAAATAPPAGAGSTAPIVVRVDTPPPPAWVPGRPAPPPAPVLDPVREVYEALVLGTRDYVAKNGFTDVVIGLSGGVDSSLVATVAVDALGADRVHGVSMPSRFSSEGSVADARALAVNLGIDLRLIPIESLHAAFESVLAPVIPGFADGLAAENVQARIRGTTLMALSNAFGWLVLTTGNKSEMAVGFSTLYGDLAGGFAVIKDVTKTLVYELCTDRNRRAGVPGGLIPEPVLTKPPSAELRPGQRDDQSLPPYDQLDPVLEAYVEGDATVAMLESAGFDPALVRRVTTLVDRAEYKRRQAPPGIRVTAKAFGKDRRLPLTNHYRG